MKSAKQLFEELLLEKNIEIISQTEKTYIINNGSSKLNVTIENLEKEYDRVKSPEIVRLFVDQILNIQEVPSEWQKASKRIFLSLEPSNYDFENIIYEKITEFTNMVAVYVDENDFGMTWITTNMLQEWNVDIKELRQVAKENMRELFNSVPLKILNFNQTPIVCFETNSLLKASLILSPQLKSKIKSLIGWPILALVPCRDFVYILSEKNLDLVNRLGGIVLKEFSCSGYPLTTEVLKISDNGITAIGKFRFE
ncbi:MAG: hypothetical protein JW891_03420 [Candidatus Lokiarchaeota archaeon]|nr:hypothetical protein [Candidatus Lokiarchaeota archaeon]